MGKVTAYYNEIEPYPAAWLRNLIAAGLIPAGEVDERSIVDVRPDDLRGFVQCHFFAGIGGWALAARMAGWPDDRALWTGSCPCQPFSVAGKQKGFDDERHLWPVWRDLIAECRPATIFGEQVAGAAGWLGLVRSDLEALGYAVGAMPIEAASAGADHRRDRFWLVAYAARELPHGGGRAWDGRAEPSDGSALAYAADCGREDRIDWMGGSICAPRGQGGPQADGATRFGPENGRALADADLTRPQGRPVHAERPGQRAAGSDSVGWIVGADGKTRRLPQPGIRLLAHDVPARVGRLCAYGNAIVPKVAAEVIGAFMECRPSEFQNHASEAAE